VRTSVVSAIMLAAAVGGSEATHAQNITVGAKFGYSRSSLTEAELFSSEGDFLMGGYFSLGVGRILYLSAEGLYEQRRASSEQSDAFEQVFLSVPLLVGARLSTGLLQPRLYAGASVSFALDCTSIEGSVTVGDPECSQLLDTRGQTWSGAVGAGLDLALLLVVLNADVRYNFGLSEISSDPAFASKWNGWMFTLGAGIRLGG